jgi:hypothetical protein
VEGRAALVDEEKETERIHSLFLTKYWTARISSWFGGGFGTGRIVRIEPLTSARGGAPAPSSDGAASAATPPARPPE